ncbi:MAG: ABC transporter ATP-binding protein [Candidatus Doudnabacteria bacterium]|nr:ABC transporter ATP-binding protein [Candidatus Doudnabacteria bacterium]
MINIIEVRNLTKKYNDFTAVDGINFDVRQGEVFGILGPNGAGKTTTLEMMEGLKSITAGQAILDNHDVSKDTRLVKSLIGVQLQSSSFFEGLNLVELLETFASLYDRKVDAMQLLREVQLEEKAKNQHKELSGGQKQRFSIAAALVNDPKVLFLDEPTTGLDPQARRNLWELIQQINKRGKTIVITTHYMDEAELLCDRIAVMDHAKIVMMDTTENLLKLPGLHSSVVFQSETDVPHERLMALPGVTDVQNGKLTYRLVTTDPEKTLTSLFSLAHALDFKILDLQLKQPTLEDVFLKLTGHALRD